MLRRQAVAALLGLGAGPLASASKNLATLIGSIPGAALLIDAHTRQLNAVYAQDLAGALLAPPGSAIKPFTIQALLQAGKIRTDEAFHCPGNRKRPMNPSSQLFHHAG